MKTAKDLFNYEIAAEILGTKTPEKFYYCFFSYSKNGYEIHNCHNPRTVPQIKERYKEIIKATDFKGGEYSGVFWDRKPIRNEYVLSWIELQQKVKAGLNNRP